MQLSDSEINGFREVLTRYYEMSGRPQLPWRLTEADGSFDAYKILVSELMLQQTQVNRVIPKFDSFLRQFPNVQALAATPLAEVLQTWNGLGYNRRAKYLHEAGKALVGQPQPWSYEKLVALKGIGPNTAAAVLVYAYNRPHVFIETNIRTVYIHHFFADKADIADREITELLTQTIDHQNPREFYWQLMDYGTYLKANVGNAGRASKHYARQSAFAGSRRQIRGLVIRELTKHACTDGELNGLVNDERLKAVLTELASEQLIHFDGMYYALGS